MVSRLQNRAWLMLATCSPRDCGSKVAGCLAAVASSKRLIHCCVDVVAHKPNRAVSEADVNSRRMVAAGIQGLRTVVSNRCLRRLLEGHTLINLRIANSCIG